MDKRSLASMEKELLEKVLSKTRWNLDKAAKLLQISSATLKRKIREHGIERDPA